MSNLLHHTANLVQQDFQLEELPAVLDETALLEFLTELVEQLIATNLERLFWVLYRLDIAEEKVHQALSLQSKMPAAPTLARLILIREQQKAQSRLTHQQEDVDDDVTPW